MYWRKISADGRRQDPGWLLEKIKKAPSKYRLNDTVKKMSTQTLEAILSKQNIKGGTKDTTLTIAYSVSYGNKMVKGTCEPGMNKASPATLSKTKMEPFHIPLTDPKTPGLDISLFACGEPVPGAEVFVELEPDDQPSCPE